MKEENVECTKKIKEGKGTLILKDNYRGILPGENRSVTYTEKELMIMYKKYFPGK